MLAELAMLAVLAMLRVLAKLLVLAVPGQGPVREGKNGKFFFGNYRSFKKGLIQEHGKSVFLFKTYFPNFWVP